MLELPWVLLEGMLVVLVLMMQGRGTNLIVDLPWILPEGTWVVLVLMMYRELEQNTKQIVSKAVVTFMSRKQRPNSWAKLREQNRHCKETAKQANIEC